MDAIRGWNGTTDDNSKHKVIVQADRDVEKRLWTVRSCVGEMCETRKGTFQSGDTGLGCGEGKERGLVRGGGGVGGVRLRGRMLFLWLLVGLEAGAMRGTRGRRWFYGMACATTGRWGRLLWMS